MTSRERVHRCLEFAKPDRVPRDLWMLPAARQEHGNAAIDDFVKRWPSDFTQCNAGRKPAKLKYGDPYKPGQSRDEWGCVFENLMPGVHGEVKNPLIDDWSKLSDLRPPVELLEVDTAAAADFCKSTDLFVFASGWARPFERIQFLRGTENVFMDLAEDSPEFFEMLRIVHEFYLKQYELWARTPCDALVMMDDWGSQRSLLISPAQWRRVFKPLYAQYAQVAHDHGKKFFMHSDGHIFDIYEDLIEIGIDAINSQLFCMDIEQIGRRFKGRISFWGEIDRQHVIPYGTEQETRDAVKRVVDNLWSPDGGVIAQFELTPGGKLANAQAIYETWYELTGASS